jgi:3-hydroxyacyl-CoA dehydrogenase
LAGQRTSSTRRANLRLVEVIPTADTDPAVLARMSAFRDRDLGKGVVVAKDTPNFIANHIALFGVVQTPARARVRRLLDRRDRRHHGAGNRPAEERHFRTMDIAGIDVLGHVMSNLATRLARPGPSDVRDTAADCVARDRARLGGRESRTRLLPEGRARHPHLDPATFEYRPQRR